MAQVEHGDVAGKQVLRLVERDRLVQRGDRGLFRQQNPLSAGEHHVPTPLAHPNEAAQPLIKRLRRLRQLQRLGHDAPRAKARDQRQVGTLHPFCQGPNLVPTGVEQHQPFVATHDHRRHPLLDLHLQHAARPHEDAGPRHGVELGGPCPQSLEIEVEGAHRQTQPQRLANLPC